MKKQVIKDIFTKLGKKEFGFVLNGTKYGDMKWWWPSGQLKEHAFIDEKHGGPLGENKWWHPDGTLLHHSFSRVNILGKIVETNYIVHGIVKKQPPKNLKSGFILGSDGKYYHD